MNPQEITLIVSTVCHAFVASAWSRRGLTNVLIKAALVCIAVAVGLLAARGLS